VRSYIQRPSLDIDKKKKRTKLRSGRDVRGLIKRENTAGKRGGVDFGVEFGVKDHKA
jgi:hypothetical protein